MIRKFLAGVLLLLTGAVIIYSCNKNDQSGTSIQGYNTRIIPEQMARAIAQRITIDFLKGEPTNQLRGEGDATDLPNRQIEGSITVPDAYDNPALYVYNYTNDSGFVVISADARHEPICAYIESGKLQEGEAPSMFVQWFDATVENIEMVRTGTVDNTARANYAWYELLTKTDLTYLLELLRPIPIDDPPPSCDDGWITTIRGPFLQTAWGQWCTYNEQAPSINCTNGCWTNPNAPTGCVATAMSQVLRYWAHPNQFGYNYASMPNFQGNGEVQRMMRDAANSVNMNWGCAGSGAQASVVDNAFHNPFAFSSASYNNYSSSSYLTVKSNLNNGWPVLLGGCNRRRNRFLGIIWSYSECHQWVCDGYWATQNHCYGYLRFHMNWGWHEAFGGNDFNGWYAFNLWNPGTRNFQYAQDYVYNIHP